MIEERFLQKIAGEVQAQPHQVAAAIQLFDKGATVPFVARYRKDNTGNLNEVKLETIEERNLYFIALTNRREAILENIKGQSRLTPELEEQIRNAETKQTLEDLYLPFKKQRRTKAEAARKQGLGPLAEFLWEQMPDERGIPAVAETFISEEQGIGTADAALEGARHILAERVSVDTETRIALRKCMQEEGKLTAKATKLAEQERSKFEDYHDFSQPLKDVPAYRLLAMLRGLRTGWLRVDVIIDDEKFVSSLQERYTKEAGSPFAEQFRLVVEDAYNRLLKPAIENEVIGEAREHAEDSAIRTFRENARHLLLAPPVGGRAVLGVDPGIRSGCKLAVIDASGNYVESAVIVIGDGESERKVAEETLKQLLGRDHIQIIGIGNGTGSHEASKFITDTLRGWEREDVDVVYVNEAGASIYSASQIARDEFPDLDVTIRGAISIARRLQDPLAELVKLDPKHLGVGQYQHDVNKKRLREALQRTIESCVNHVGVEINTASAELLRYVSGIQMGTAQNIVEFRRQHGGFTCRTQLMEVSGIGEKTFEQCAGFLRIANGGNPLDATGIHPEAYPVIEKMAAAAGAPVAEVIRNTEKIASIDFESFKSDDLGQFALTDIRQELEKPGRDPRPAFRAPKFLQDVHKVDDLKEGMISEGVVTNVTDFGAFIDVGVHQDGLIHLSELAHRFVRDPREVLQVGDIVKVKVTKVDIERNRISLSRKAVLPEGRRKRRAVARPEQAADAAAPASREDRSAPSGETPRRRRPDRHAEGKRSEGRREDSPRRKGKSNRGGTPRGGAPRGGRESGSENMNTQLADQLAALKDKLGN